MGNFYYFLVFHSRCVLLVFDVRYTVWTGYHFVIKRLYFLFFFSFTTGWIGSLGLASATLGSPITSALLVYFPYRFLVLGGLLLCTISLVCSSFVSSVYYLLLTYGLSYGFGISLYNQAAIVFILRIFSGSSRAFGIIFSGTKIGKSDIVIIYYSRSKCR